MLAVVATAAADAFTAAVPNQVLTIGTDEPLDITVPVGSSRVETVSFPGASYIAVYLADFALPAGDFVVVRSPVDSSAAAPVAHYYDGKGRDDRGDFIASLVPGNTAVVQCVSATNSSSSGDVSVSKSSPAALRVFTISGFSRGFPAAGTTSGDKESICGARDNSRPAKCYATERPEVYRKACAVARLVIGGTKACTGSGGYVITNNHCIPDAAAAASIEFEFGAESDSCASTTCGGQLGCRKPPVATTSTLVLTSSALDYSVVKLPETADVSARSRADLHPQHPEGFVKRISAVVGNGSAAKIESLAIASSCGGTNRVGYLADTEPSSSGSPVLAASDNAVVALHNCGGCLNAGVSIMQIVKHMKANNVVLPDFAIPFVAPEPTPEPTLVPTQPQKPPVNERCSGLNEVLCLEFLCEWSGASTSCSSFQREHNPTAS